jgi:hypothetical protein
MIRRVVFNQKGGVGKSSIEPCGRERSAGLEDVTD